MVDNNDVDAKNKAQVERISTSLLQKFPAPEVTPRELQDKLRTGQAVVVDVRQPEERKVSMIPGSITPAELESNLEQYKDSTVVCYCTIGYRSLLYAQSLQKQGVNAANLRGSILAWVHEGLPVVTGDGSQDTRQVHVFNDDFALQPSGYTPVKFSSTAAAIGGIKFMAWNKLPKWLGGSM